MDDLYSLDVKRVLKWLDDKLSEKVEGMMLDIVYHPDVSEEGERDVRYRAGRVRGLADARV